MYARRRQPQFNNFHTKKISELYADLRQSAEKHNGIPIAVRHIESIMRMAEAHARMRLSDQVTDADANAAIRVMLESFVQSQKYSAKRALRKEFSKYITASTQHHDLLLHLLQSLVAENVAIRQVCHVRRVVVLECVAHSWSCVCYVRVHVCLCVTDASPWHRVFRRRGRDGRVRSGCGDHGTGLACACGRVRRTGCQDPHHFHQERHVQEGRFRHQAGRPGCRRY